MASEAAELPQAGGPALASVTSTVQPDEGPGSVSLTRPVASATTSARVGFTDAAIDLRDGRPVLDVAPEAPVVRPRTDLPAGQLRAKRALDVVFALGALSIAGIPMVLLGAAIRIASPGPALFRQTRVGRDGEHFACLKFRTMRLDADGLLEELLESDPALAAEFEAGYKLRNDPRITRFGGVLRQSSIDELPQLINVLRGDMSLVGPRPLQPDETVRYGDVIDAVLSVRPGMTGLWQVSGRNDLSYEERIDIDGDYVDAWRFVDDLKILLRTIPALAFPGRNGAY